MKELLNYKIGLIFIDDEDYANKSEWCNANSCYIEEIEPKDDGTRQFTIKEIVVPILTLEEEIEKKHAELKSIMQAKRNALTCEYANDVFDCNEQAQANMTSLMSFANLGMKEFFIRSTNERTHTFNDTQLVELATIMSKTINNLYSEYWSYKNALYECKTKEEIDKIQWKI